MEHLLLKAVATRTTDQGEFEAVISTSAIDREKDVVEPDAMRALQAWTVTNKKVPLHWNHRSEPEDIVGHVDLDTERGRQAWRLMKAGSVGFSFGYLVPEGGAKAPPGGGRRRQGCSPPRRSTGTPRSATGHATT
jgi:hypothetical protein